MLSKEKILGSFKALNEELMNLGQKGEIGIVGGAVMCLVYNAREATRDVDAVFEPSSLLRLAAAKVAEKLDLSHDWLNDGAKGFITGSFKRETVQVFSNLLIWAPEARYMLAMKCISARLDSSDLGDVKFLLKYLEISEIQVVLDLIQNYYPRNQIPPKTQFLLEEILSTK